MGCGQSKIHLYPRKSKSKANGKRGGHADSDAETDEDESYFDDPEKCQNREQEKPEVTDEQSNKSTPETDEEVSVSLLRAKNLSLLQSQEISTSQQNFFRMLDKKIDEGPDYDSASETEIALEEARLNALVQHWESASLTASICSSASRSLQSTPIRQAPIKQLVTPRNQLKSSFGVPQQVLASEYPQIGTSPQPPMQLTAVGPINVSTGQIPMNLLSDGTVTTANTSNVLALMQTTTTTKPTQQQITHLLALPAGSGQLLGKPNISPKHLADGRLLISTSPLAQQMQQQQQQQQQQLQQPMQLQMSHTMQQALQQSMPMQSPYIATSVISAATATPANLGSNARAQQQQQMVSLPMTCYSQSTLQQNPQTPHPADMPLDSPSSFGDIIHNVQAPTEYRFPPAISVQRLAPQVQRQIRETQELIKDSCPQLYAAGYGSPGPPIRNPARNPTRRPTLETQLSQELS